jgi:mannose-6-phosphate isomerase
MPIYVFPLTVPTIIMASMIQLECKCNNNNYYSWRKSGKDTLAAQYATATPGTKFQIDSSSEDLQKHINANKEKLIRKPILSKFGADLPKVFTPADSLCLV